MATPPPPPKSMTMYLRLLKNKLSLFYVLFFTGKSQTDFCNFFLTGRIYSNEETSDAKFYSCAWNNFDTYEYVQVFWLANLAHQTGEVKKIRKAEEARIHIFFDINFLCEYASC